jgi:uncharacterized membrane protein SpoIIM required for sporulation
MVLEELISPERAEKHPWEMLFMGMIYSSVAVFLSLYLFGGDDSSLIFVFFTVMACSILMYKTIKFEEFQDLGAVKEFKLLEHHGKALAFFIFLFLGFLISFSLWYVFLPEDISSSVFHSQVSVIRQINSNNADGMFIFNNVFGRIFMNNIKVLLFSVFFSFFYGMGAIFILVWNASVVGAATGMFIKGILAKTLESAGLLSVSHYFSAISLGLSRYLIHGIPEMAAYFVGGLAGGLISVAMIKHSTNSEQFSRVIKDSSVLLCTAVLIIFVAALLEVYITPIFF